MRGNVEWNHFITFQLFRNRVFTHICRFLALFLRVILFLIFINEINTGLAVLKLGPRPLGLENLVFLHLPPHTPYPEQWNTQNGYF